MNKINISVEKIHTELLNIIGETLHYDLSGDAISKIQDKKHNVIKAIFDLQNEIKKQTDGKYYAG